MWPVLLDLGFPITSYGLFGALGFLVASFYAMARAARVGMPGNRVVDVLVAGGVFGVLGARVVYLVQTGDTASFFALRSGGLVFYGALLALPMAAVVARLRELPILPLADEIAVALPLVHAISRIGCLLAGCCWGAPTDLPWGLTYSDPLAPAPHGIALHPAVLYEAIGLLGLAGALTLFAPFKTRDGQTMFAYLTGYAVLRSIVELWRGDDRGTLLFDALSFSQGVSLLVVPLAGLVLLVLPRFLAPTMPTLPVRRGDRER
jgi:phosphatidylglycerol:prolipoprotein diacylglycerol transferase